LLPGMAANTYHRAWRGGFSGDLVLGDDTGVVVIPRDREEGLVAALDDLLVAEDRLVQGIRQGTCLVDMLDFGDLLKLE